MVKKSFFGYVVAFGLTTFLTVGGLSISKAYAGLLDCSGGCSLQYLMDHPEDWIQVGDKIFSSFSGSSTAYNTTPVPLASVMVTPAPLSSDGYGISFQLPFANDVYANQGKDLLVSFTVATQFGNDLIIGDYLKMTGDATGNAVAKILEIVEDENNNALNTLQVWDDPNRIPMSKFTDTGLFNTAQNILKITKDISWYALPCPTSTACNNQAWISDFTQRFPQIPPTTGDTTGSSSGNSTGQVPEPASMLLLGFGLAGLGIVRRKRSTK